MKNAIWLLSLGVNLPYKTTKLVFTRSASAMPLSLAIHRTRSGQPYLVGILHGNVVNRVMTKSEESEKIAKRFSMIARLPSLKTIDVIGWGARCVAIKC